MLRMRMAQVICLLSAVITGEFFTWPAPSQAETEVLQPKIYAPSTQQVSKAAEFLRAAASEAAIAEPRTPKQLLTIQDRIAVGLFAARENASVMREARELIEAASHEGSEPVRAFQRLQAANLLIYVGNNDEAKPLLDSVLQSVRTPSPTRGVSSYDPLSDTLLANVAVLKVRAGLFDAVPALIRRIQLSDRGASAWVRVARAAFAMGHPTEANACLDMARAYIRRLDTDHARTQGYRQIAALLAEQELLRDALAAADAMEVQFERLASLQELLASSLRAKDTQTASASLASIVVVVNKSDPEAQIESWLNVAMAQAAAGDAAGARDSLQKSLTAVTTFGKPISPEKLKRMQIREAVVHAYDEDFEAAMKLFALADAVPEASRSPFAGFDRGRLAKALIATGHLADALRIADGMTNDRFTRPSILEALITARAQSGDYAAARQLLATVDAAHQHSALSGLAAAWARRGDDDAGLAVLYRSESVTP